DHFADIGAAVRDAADLVRLIQTNWLPFRLGLLSLGLAALEQTTSTGWTYKDLAAHAAAWEERTATRLAVFRESGEGVVGVDGTDPFNAAVVERTRSRDGGDVLRELDEAHRALAAEVEKLTPGQLHANDDWVITVVAGNSYGHYAEHHEELFAAVPRKPGELLAKMREGWRPFRNAVGRVGLIPLSGRTPARSSRGSMTSGGASAPGFASAAAADSARRRPRAGPTRTYARMRRRGCRKPYASSPRTSSPTGTRARSRSSTTARSRRIVSSVRRRCSMSSTRLPGGCARRPLRFRTSASRTRKSSTSSRGVPTSTGKITSPSLGTTFDTADPRGHGEGRSRRPRPRREDRGTRAARRRHGGDLHRRASNAGTGRRDRAAGGCRCHRRIAPVRSPQLHLSADRRAHEGKRNGRRPAVRRWDHPGGRRGRSGQGRGGARLSTGRIARRDHDIRQGSGSTKAWRALITKAKGRSKMAKKDDRPIDAGLAALHGKSEQEAIDFWKSRFGMIAAIPSDTA